MYFLSNFCSSKFEYVVFDLNLLLNISEDNYDTTPDGSFIYKNKTYYLYKKLYADSFINFLLQHNIKYGIWTYESRSMTYAMIKNSFPIIRKTAAFIKSLRSCIIQNEIYVKNTSQITKCMLFIDYNTEQVTYHLQNNLKHYLILQTDSDKLKQIFWHVRKLIFQKYIVFSKETNKKTKQIKTKVNV